MTRENSQQRHVLVTGGGKGIGRAIAGRFASAGYSVTIFGRDVTALRNASDELGVDARPVDVMDAEQLEGAVRSLPPVDILVNNVGAAMSKPFAQQAIEDWHQMMAINVYSSVSATQLVLGGMVARGWGRVINIASTAGLVGYRYSSAYCAAKHALVGMTRALAIETATTGVTVNCICPGFTDTELFQRAVATVVQTSGRDAAAATSALVSGNPQRRLITPEEVAALALHLATDEARGLTGLSLPVAGGEVM